MNVLSNVRIEKFASRARAYICTYHHLDQEQQRQELQSAPGDTTDHAPINCLKQERLSYSEIEKLTKVRCRVLDFDSGFVNSQLKEAKKVDVANEEV